jgi:protein phosphatase
MGTTVTAAGVFGDDLYLTQIGDSRGYLVRNGSAIQLTRDQSLMQRLVDAGELTPEEAEQSERRNIILQALGPDPRVKVDLSHQVLRRGDVLLICSDGLSGLVKREEFARMVADHPDLPELCSALIDLANERGGPDNITVVAARFEGEGLPEPAPAEDVGYQEYELPDAEPEGPAPSEARPPSAEPVSAVEAVATEPSGRGRGLLVALAVLVLVVFLLTVLL